MRLIVHIGRTKTGTSHLQSVFAANAALLAQNGLSYQEFGKPIDINIAARGGITSGNAVLLALSYCCPSLLPEGKDPLKVREEFYKKCAAIRLPDVLISSEFFERLNEASVHQLAQMAKRLKRKLVLVGYIRNQEQAMQSIYAQGVKRHHEVHGPRTFLQTLNWDVLKYYDWLRVLANGVGRDNLIVRPFERAQFHQGRIEADFFRQIGCSDELINQLSVPDAVVNPTPGPRELQFMRIANRFQPSFDLSNALLDIYNKDNEHKYNKNSLFKMDDVNRIREFYRQDNERIYREFVKSTEDEGDRVDLFIDKYESYEEGQTSDNLELDLEGFYHIFTGLLVALFNKK